MGSRGGGARLRRPRGSGGEASPDPGALRTVDIGALVPDGNEQPFRDLMSTLFAAASTMQALRRSTASAFGVTAPELAVLVAVATLKPDPSVSRIADHLHVAGPNVTNDVGKLVRAGLLEKRADTCDGRAVRISLTKAGLDLYVAMVPQLRAVNNQLFSDLTPQDLEAVMAFLRRIVGEGGRMLLSQKSRPF